jgi:hypothetical protein
MRIFEKVLRTGARGDAQSTCGQIADRFCTVRECQFNSAVKTIQRRLGHELATSIVRLGGDADCALKGYQLWITTAFLVAHRHIPRSKSQAFFGMLNLAVAGKDSERTLEDCQECHKHRHDPAEQIVRVAFPVANYITSESHPVAVTLVADLMPIFICNTQIVLADAFGDRSTLKELQSQSELIRKQLTRS